MRNVVKTALFAFVLALASPVAAQDLDAGREAHLRGDYAAALIEWRPLAEQGDASAQRFLGSIYQYGQGVPQDHAEATKWYRAAAEQGHAGAQLALGIKYRLGEGVTHDYGEAVKWLRMAAEQGRAAAQLTFGSMYADGLGVLQDYAEALKWYRKAAEQGYAFAQDRLGGLYRSGKGVAQDNTEAEKWYRKAAEQGLAGARYDLGVMYATGEGVAQDYTEAISWYRLAADQGFAEAQVNLGFLYLQGHGVPQDHAEAAMWWRKAAVQGFATGQSGLGALYARGHGVPQDYVLAYMWFDLADRQGLENAIKGRDALVKDMTSAQIAEAQRLAREWKPSQDQTRDLTLSLVKQAAERCGTRSAAGHAEIPIIGELLVREPALSVAYKAFLAGDLGVAVAEYRFHAEQGNIAAQTNLGVMYEAGLGVAQDDYEAVQWYFKAADQGDATAQYNVAAILAADYLLIDGFLGVEKCFGERQHEAFIQAYKWLIAAAEQGHKGAIEARQILSEQMTPAQLAQAQILAREWRPK